MSLIEAIKRANRPGAPENSIALSVACGGALLTGIAAAHAQGELSFPVALATTVLVVVGMVFSYRTRARPPNAVKVVLAFAALAALVWFFHQAQGHATDVIAIQDALTVLFAWVLAVHSFHVPARRDLGFSLGGSVGLMAVAAAQAIDLHFALYAVVWAGFGLWGLTEMWASASGGARISRRGLLGALAGVAALSFVVFLVLPAPRVTIRVNLLARAGNDGVVGVPGALAGDAGAPVELARPGNSAGQSRVGGYLGFANRLDTALRGKLGNTVVMRVRADRPSYWVGETFDTWDGEGWTDTAKPDRPVGGQSPFFLPPGEGSIGVGQSDLQTFYIAQPSPDLVFHAETAHEVWFPASNVYSSADGTVVSPIGLGHGAVYSVESEVTSAGADQLRASIFGGTGLPGPVMARETQLPHPYAQAQVLAQSVTAGALTSYDKVQALIAWISANTRYSTDIPPLPAGADTVNEFLFGNRVGFCEQISTSLTVMLRSLGIPAREAVGYVPGPYNPITDLYEVRAKDAHAWVQVWFPGYGWQSFDPTADVPSANPAPGTTALHDLGHALGRIPVAPTAVLVVVTGLVLVAVRYRRRRPATWAERVAREIERAGARAGRPRQSAETLSEYAGALEGRFGERGGVWRSLARDVERSAYGGAELPASEGRQAVATARSLRRPRARTPG